MGQKEEKYINDLLNGLYGVEGSYQWEQLR